MNFMLNFNSFITNKLNFYSGIYLTWIFNFFIRIILAITFAIDVLYFHKFYYFFKFLPLLIIVLLYEYLLYCITTVAKHNLNRYSNFFIITTNINDVPNEITLTII